MLFSGWTSIYELCVENPGVARRESIVDLVASYLGVSLRCGRGQQKRWLDLCSRFSSSSSLFRIRSSRKRPWVIWGMSGSWEMCRMRWRRHRRRGKEEGVIVSLSFSVGSNEYFPMVERSYIDTFDNVFTTSWWAQWYNDMFFGNINCGSMLHPVRNSIRPLRGVRLSNPRPLRAFSSDTHTYTYTKTNSPLHSQRMLGTSLRAAPQPYNAFSPPLLELRSPKTSLCLFPSALIPAASYFSSSPILLGS